jgi:hypothetical protein
MIPKILHYIWVGPAPMPEEDKRRVETWRAFFPGWEIRAWNNDDLDFTSSYLRQAYEARAWNRVSDYVRMDALVRFGGVYLDTDVDVLRSFEPLLNADAFLGFQLGDEAPEYLVNGAVFGAVPGHWLPAAIRREFNENMDGRDDVGPDSGPGILTRMLRARGLKSYSDEPIEVDGVVIYPRRYFYPYFMGEDLSDAAVTPDTFAIHRWAFTWNPKPSLKRRMLRRLERHAPVLATKIARSARWMNLLRRKLRVAQDRPHR